MQIVTNSEQAEVARLISDKITFKSKKYETKNDMY